MLALDELIDEGYLAILYFAFVFFGVTLALQSIILEADPSQIASRVALKTDPSSGGDVPFSEQTLSQALSTAKSITRSLLK